MNEKKLQEDTIDLGKLASIAIAHKKEVGSIIAGCTILAAGISFILPPQYESTTLVQIRSAGKDIGGAAAIASMMGISIDGSCSHDSVESYIELMKSRHVLEPVIDSLEWEDVENKPSATGFAKSNLEIKNAKSNLEIKNAKKTNLITVKAKGRTPEEAQKISQGVVDNFLLMQTNMNQQTQSLLVKFLSERVEKAKEEATEAATKLANYSKEHKIYAPEDQAKLALEKLNAYDKAISELVVDQKSAQAEYDTATAKIGQQKAGASTYTINDNSTVQTIRAAIVEKQVELVGYQEQYTDEHPQVKQARAQLADLNQKLVDEVNAVVSSNAATLNTAYASLLANQAVAEAKAGAATASKEALEEKKAEVEKEMGDLPDAVMNYILLESNAKLKQEVYLSLVKQCEQDKVQKAMESMDIQVIDTADLPDKDKPSAPRKKLIMAI
ncbi:MAG: hypothetical protein J6H31_05555 [Butyrivibrio sp.]|nr:hypothetical protein [Butyrivibrio sp.]